MMKLRNLVASLSLASICLGGVACSHHHHRDRDRDDRVVINEPAPPPPPPPQVVYRENVYYDEYGRVINDPVIIRRVRYYDEAPRQIVYRDNVYYYRGRPVRGADEIRCMQLARMHELQRERGDWRR